VSRVTGASSGLTLLGGLFGDLVRSMPVLLVLSAR